MIDIRNKILQSLINSNFKEKLATAGVYLLVPIVNFSISLFTTPLFAKYLTAEEFGIMGYFTSLSTFIMCFYGLSFQTYYMSVYFRESEARRKSILVSLFLFSFAWNIIFFPISYFLLKFYFIQAVSEIDFFPYALLALSAALISGYKGFLQVNYRLESKPLSYFFITAGYRVLVTLISLYFVMSLDLGLVGRLAGILVTEIAFFAYSVISVLGRQNIKLESEVIRNAFKIILPLLPASFFFLPLGSFDNIVLEKLDNSSEMGIYNIGKGIAAYLYIALFPFYQVFEPNIYKSVVERKFKSLRNTAFGLGILVSLAILGFWLISPYAIDFLTSGKYVDSVKYANVLALANGLLIIFSFLDAILNALQETKKHLLINTLIAITCVIFYSIAGLYFQQIGVAYAVVGTHVLLILLQVIFVGKSIRKYKLRLNSSNHDTSCHEAKMNLNAAVSS